MTKSKTEVPATSWLDGAANTDARPPRVSVALATYNGERFLREQLDSLAEQTLLPAELVVSDDGSTDRTVAIVREFAGRAPFPVKLLKRGDRLNLPA